MNERAINFSGEMVKAILDGRKTQTRRIVKPQPEVPEGSIFWIRSDGSVWGRRGDEDDDAPYQQVFHDGFKPFFSKYKIGDRLWVRETWATEWDGNKSYFCYKARGGQDFDTDIRHVWKSPLFMPRLASRITLEIIGIRIERLQSISEDDCRAEGFYSEKGNGITAGFLNEKEAKSVDGSSPRRWFANLWNSIHGDGAWDLNPWVWAIEFERKE